MGAYIEALILYIIIFFSQSGIIGSGAAGGSFETASFSAYPVIINIFLFCIPSLALIWYLIYKSWKIEYWIVRPGKKDSACFLFTFPLLLITGFSVSFISAFTGGFQGQAMPVSVPSSVTGWALICVLCVLSAYLEESFFRFYLLSKREELNLNAPSALAFSTSLFAICHIYEGPWGFLNALLSGLLLGYMFLRHNSLHGVAAAHALYNIAAFILFAARG